MRERILSYIKRIAEANGGKVPGVRVFKNESGIREHEWLGVFWARWSDALKEADHEPQLFNQKADSQVYLKKICDAMNHFKKFPTAAEQKLYRKLDSYFPDPKTLRLHFGTGSGIADAVRKWID